MYISDFSQFENWLNDIILSLIYGTTLVLQIKLLPVSGIPFRRNILGSFGPDEPSSGVVGDWVTGVRSRACHARDFQPREWPGGLTSSAADIATWKRHSSQLMPPTIGSQVFKCNTIQRLQADRKQLLLEQHRICRGALLVLTICCQTLNNPKSLEGRSSQTLNNTWQQKTGIFLEVPQTIQQRQWLSSWSKWCSSNSAGLSQLRLLIQALNNAEYACSILQTDTFTCNKYSTNTRNNTSYY